MALPKRIAPPAQIRKHALAQLHAGPSHIVVFENGSDADPALGYLALAIAINLGRSMCNLGAAPRRFCFKQ